MYIGIGNNKTVRKKDIIAFFDADRITISAVTKKFLSDAEKNGRIFIVGDDIPKSVIICDENKNFSVYLSKLSVAAIRKRIDGDSGLKLTDINI